MIRSFMLVLGFKLVTTPVHLYAQTVTYSQFWNDFQFVTPIKGKWSNEINIGQVWTSLPDVKGNPFHASSQLYGRIWLHYALPKLKLSVFTGYNYNAEIITIGQEGLPEIRSGIQGTYYFKRSPYILTARLRLEDHLDKRRKEGFDQSYRVRSQVKIVKALNGPVISAGKVYVAASEEVFTQTAPDIFSNPRFGSNRLTIGLGYALTDVVLMEVDYSNDYYMGNVMHTSCNTLQVNFSCYNWVENLKNALWK